MTHYFSQMSTKNEIYLLLILSFVYLNVNFGVAYPCGSCFNLFYFFFSFFCSLTGRRCYYHPLLVFFLLLSFPVDFFFPIVNKESQKCIKGLVLNCSGENYTGPYRHFHWRHPDTPCEAREVQLVNIKYERHDSLV